MIKVKELQGPSCLTRAAYDEPLFVLRANDESAPYAVRAWTDAYRIRKEHENHGPLTDTQKQKLAEALQIATDMEVWYEARSSRAVCQHNLLKAGCTVQLDGQGGSTCLVCKVHWPPSF